MNTSEFSPTSFFSSTSLNHERTLEVQNEANNIRLVLTESIGSMRLDVSGSNIVDLHMEHPDLADCIHSVCT